MYLRRHVLADAYSVRVYLQSAPIVVCVSTLTPILREALDILAVIGDRIFRIFS